MRISTHDLGCLRSHGNREACAGVAYPLNQWRAGKRGFQVRVVEPGSKRPDESEGLVEGSPRAARITYRILGDARTFPANMEPCNFTASLRLGDGCLRCLRAART